MSVLLTSEQARLIVAPFTTLTIPGDPCPECGGHGVTEHDRLDHPDHGPCNECGCSGVVAPGVWAEVAGQRTDLVVKCERCEGDGVVDDETVGVHEPAVTCDEINPECGCSAFLCPDCDDGSVRVARADVEVLPVVGDWEHPLPDWPFPCVFRIGLIDCWVIGERRDFSNGFELDLAVKPRPNLDWVVVLSNVEITP
jgi:hypothetical protein